MYLAKSNGESLVDHTNNLLDQLHLLRQTYSDVLTDHEWNLLKLACCYHDMGKINALFQKKIRKCQSTIEGEIPHGLLSATMIPYDRLKDQFSDKELKILAYAVATHHNRNLEKYNKDWYRQESSKLAKQEKTLDLSGLKYPLLLNPQPFVTDAYYSFQHEPDAYIFGKNNPILGSASKDEGAYQLFVKIKGLLNRCDYAASGHYAIESTPRFDLDQNVLAFLGEKAHYNDLQNWTYMHQNDNIVVVAQTGMGKTESALRWLGNDKSFFVLPLKTAINAMYDRFKGEIFANDQKLATSDMALLHSDMLSKLIKDVDECDFDNQLNEDRQWSKQLTVATLDQIFSFVYHYAGYEPKLATLSYAKVVIDEIQMYSPELLAYLAYGLKEIQNYGGKFDVMTATLSPFVLDLFKENGIKFIQPNHPFLDKKVNHRHKVKVMHEELTAEDVKNFDQNQKTLVVVNTVNKAIELYQQLKDAGKNVHLIHSRFIKKDRVQKEKDIFQFTQAGNHEHGIWIGTQVVEASLDIDFDLLITELSELNGLFQRMGRCYRKRNYNGKLPNVYVFDGGDKNPSGVNRGEHSVVNYQMYELSKQALNTVDGYLSETDKIDLINNNYTTANLSNGENSYVIKTKNALSYLISVQTQDVKKTQVDAMFRNIQSRDVIPEQVYLDNKDEIDRNIGILLDKNFSRFDKIKARTQLNLLQVNVFNFLVQDENLIDNENLNKMGYFILSSDYNYDHETGLSIKKIKKEKR